MVQRDFIIDYSKLETSIVSWIKSYVESNNLESLVVEISSDICSFVCSTIAAKTNLPVKILFASNVGDENVLAAHVEWLKNNFNNLSIFDPNPTVTRHQIATDYNGVIIESTANVKTFLFGILKDLELNYVRLLPFADLYESELHEFGKSLGVIDVPISYDSKYEWGHQWCHQHGLTHPPELNEIEEELGEDQKNTLQNYRQLYLQNLDKIEVINNIKIYTFAADYDLET